MNAEELRGALAQNRRLQARILRALEALQRADAAPRVTAPRVKDPNAPIRCAAKRSESAR